MPQGIKHLVTCRCVLPQFKTQENPPFHQFMVFSVIDDDDKVQVKYAQCNSCGVIHKVVDACRSEIMTGREHLNSIMSVDDIKVSVPEQLSAILERHDVPYATWEQTKWIFDNERWGDIVVLSNETVDGIRQVKYLRVIGKGLFQVNNHVEDAYL